MTRRPADWQLPAGVDRGLWDYLHDAALARGYDNSLAGTPLFDVDQAFVVRHCEPEDRVLDLGCGTGRLLLALAARGHAVVGVDLSKEMLAVAAEKAAVAELNVQLVQANLTDLACFADGSFDVAACLFSTLGMVRGETHRRRAVAEVFRLLRPGGRFVFHVHNRWFNFWTPGGRSWLLRNSWSSLLGRIEAGERIMPVHQGIAGLTLHLFTRSEAIALLRWAGFKIAEVKPLSLSRDGELRWPSWFGWLRAYGYLLAGRKT